MSTAYRYTLHRAWGDRADQLCWVMLNPSTADDTVDDPTIRRCIRFARDNEFGALEVVNLFAARATNPRELARVVDPVGPVNDVAIASALMRATAVVFAWGAFAHRDVDVLGRASLVRQMTLRHHHVPKCLGMTKAGAPRHPLYVGADQPLVRWV